MEEFVHYFDGFWGTRSKCHIRIISEKDKPLVVICSQGNFVGTSITNKSEYLVSEILQYLERNNFSLSRAIQHYVEKNRLSTMLEDFINNLKEKPKTIFLLESLKLALAKHEEYKAQKEKINSMLWVEHYSATASITGKALYQIVSFSESWKPTWRPVSLEFLVKETGYTLDELTVNDDFLDNKI